MTDIDYRPRGERPCPACPDGSVWDSNGPTAKICPICNGYATVNLDGSPIAPPFEHHDHRDTGDPMEKRDIGSASDWERDQQREHIPGVRHK